MIDVLPAMFVHEIDFPEGEENQSQKPKDVKNEDDNAPTALQRVQVHGVETKEEGDRGIVQ